MKVTFNLNNDQCQRASKIVQRVSLERAEIDTSSLCYRGNLLIDDYHTFGFNGNQHLNFDAGQATVTYVGERHPLHQDGAIDALREIFGGDVYEIEPFEYESSVPEMKWHELHVGYISRTGSPWDILSYVLFTPVVERTVYEYSYTVITGLRWTQQCAERDHKILSNPDYTDVQEAIKTVQDGGTPRRAIHGMPLDYSDVDRFLADVASVFPQIKDIRDEIRRIARMKNVHQLHASYANVTSEIKRVYEIFAQKS